MSAKEEAMAVIAVLTMAWAVLGTMGAVVKKSDDVQPLELIVQELSSQVSSLQAQLTAVQSALHQIQAAGSQRVAFTASIHEQNVLSASGHVIPFSRVITNVGNAYDSVTSAFRAPYDGQYMIFVSVDVSRDYKSLDIYQNGRIIIPGHNDADDHHIFAGGAITLQAGDEMTIRHHGTAGAVDGGPEAIFCGFTI